MAEQSNLVYMFGVSLLHILQHVDDGTSLRSDTNGHENRCSDWQIPFHNQTIDKSEISNQSQFNLSIRRTLNPYLLVIGYSVTKLKICFSPFSACRWC